MRSLLVTVAAVASLGIGTASVQAMPAGAPTGVEAAPHVTLVAEGCGFGFRRTLLGRCVPVGGYGRPIVERRCFVRDTAFGPRRICR